MRGGPRDKIVVPPVRLEDRYSGGRQGDTDDCPEGQSNGNPIHLGPAIVFALIDFVLPIAVVRMGVDPAGFVGREQWPAGGEHTAKQVASIISTWTSSNPELGNTMTDGLFAALEAAGNYIDAGATADRIATLSGLTDEQWDRLDTIYWKNDQLFTGVLPRQALKPFYLRHAREWPPPKTVPPAAAADPWATAPKGHEPPY